MTVAGPKYESEVIKKIIVSTNEHFVHPIHKVDCLVGRGGEKREGRIDAQSLAGMCTTVAFLPLASFDCCDGQVGVLERG